MIRNLIRIAQKYTEETSVWIARLTYTHWRVLRSNELGDNTGMDLNLILRTAAFGVWVTLGLRYVLFSFKTEVLRLIPIIMRIFTV